MKKQINAGNEQLVRERNKKIELSRDQELNDLRALLVLPEFRRLMWRYMSECKIFATSFTGNSTTFFNEGTRQVGLKILADLTEARPDAFIEMMKEAKEGES